MPGVMADTDNQGNVVPQRDPSPELQRQRGKCWGKFWCLGSSRKRGMRICPARQEGPASATNAWGSSNGASSSTAANQFVGLSPSLLAPPSSPASFANSGNPSTVQSPASFTVSLCVPAASSCSPAFDSTATMFTIGPYAHETTLVTPPAFSAFTTAPSTAPFTPPPELAHLTTPSSPDVPFAQLLTSLKNKGAVAGGAAPPYSASPFASPDYVSRGDMQASYHLYPESPLTSLISPASGVSESGPPSPLPELEFPAAITAAKAAKATSVRLAASLCDRRARLGHETPQSLDSNNHSRELEPIKILSPPRGEYEERWCSRTLDSCSTSNAAAAAAAAAATKSMSSSLLEDLPRRSLSCGIDEVELKRSLSQVGALPRGVDDDDRVDADVDTMVVEDSQQSTSALLRAGAADADADADDDIPVSLRDEEGRTEQIETTHSRPDGVCSSSSSLDRSGDLEGEAKRCEEQALESPRSESGIILEVEITPDELVKVNITGAKNKKNRNGIVKKNGFHHHHHHHHHHHRHHHNHCNGFVASSKSSWEDLDAMSVDCMELNLADNTIKSPLTS